MELPFLVCCSALIYIKIADTKNQEAPANVTDSEFRKYLYSKEPYVDKTNFIAEAVRKPRTFMITKPRGYGKTLNLDMLKEFLRIDRCSKEIFDKDWYIMQDQFKNIRDQFMNKVPVIYISMKSVGDFKTFKKAKKELQRVIQKSFREFDFVRDKLGKNDQYFDPKKVWTEKELQMSISILCERVLSYYRKRPFLLVDDIDILLANAAMYGYLSEMASFMPNFGANSFEWNKCCEQIILTGVLPCTAFPDYLNSVIDLYDKSCFICKDCFGFTQAEVHKLTIRFPKGTYPNLMQDLTSWYNNFNVHSMHCRLPMYSPRSVIKSCVDGWKLKNHAELTDLTVHLLTKSGVLPALNLQYLMTNKTMVKSLATWYAVCFDFIFSSEEYLWRFLDHAGVIAIKRQGGKYSGSDQYRISIPSREIQMTLDNAVIQPLIEQGKIPNYQEFATFVDKWDQKKVKKFVGSYIENAGKWLIHEWTHEQDVAEYIKLIMRHFNVKVWEETYYNTSMTFYDTKGEPKVSFFIERCPSVWEKVKASVLSPLKEKKLVAKVARILVFMIKGGIETSERKA